MWFFSHESHMWKLLLFFESIIQKETYTLINNVCMCSFEKDTYIFLYFTTKPTILVMEQTVSSL